MSLMVWRNWVSLRPSHVLSWVSHRVVAGLTVNLVSRNHLSHLTWYHSNISLHLLRLLWLGLMLLLLLVITVVRRWHSLPVESALVSPVLETFELITLLPDDILVSIHSLEINPLLEANTLSASDILAILVHLTEGSFKVSSIRFFCFSTSREWLNVFSLSDNNGRLVLDLRAKGRDVVALLIGVLGVALLNLALTVKQMSQHLVHVSQLFLHHSHLLLQDLLLRLWLA